MNVNTIRALDLWAGRALCWALTVYRRLRGRVVPERASSDPVKKVLFIKLIEQGATVLACDAVGRAADRVGRSQVYFCVFEENRAILDLLDLVPPENILVIRNGNLWTFVLDVLKTMIRVRRLGIDAVIDMEFFSRASAILAHLSGARFRVGFHRFTTEGPYRGDLMTHRIQYNPYLHTATVYSLLVDALLMDPGDVPLPKTPPFPLTHGVPRFVPDPEISARVRDLLPDIDGPVILLNPNAGDLMPLRKWSQDRFVELGRRILESEPHATIVITGAPSEQAPAETLCRTVASPRAVCLAGKTTLHELLALYTLADILVTNDSGPAHFAALTDIHTVVLFGPETPVRYAPLGLHLHVLWAGLACSPCVNAFNHRFSPCILNRCMQAIEVDRVFETVRACLADRLPRGKDHV